MADNKGKAALKNPFEQERDKKQLKKDLKKLTKEVELRDGEKVSHETLVSKDEEVFKDYKPLSEISGKIAEELIGDFAYYVPEDIPDVSKYVSKLKYKEIMDKGLLFFMSTDTGLKRTGLLSLFPALSTGIRLYSKMSESESKAELLLKIKFGIEAVFKFIYRDKNWREDKNLPPVFDASPYESDSKAFYAGSNAEDFGGRSYIDSISWAVELFFKIMNLVDEKQNPVFDNEVREEAKKLIKWCLSYVNNAVLKINATDATDNNKPYQRPVGWNFSKIEASSQDAKERNSLYFTYAAANLYLSFYEEYKDFLDDLQTLNRAHDKVLKRAHDDEDDTIKNLQTLDKAQDKEAILSGKKYNFDQEEEVIKAYVSIDKDNEDELWGVLKRLKECNRRKLKEYYYFNDNKSAEYNGKIYKVEELESLGSISKLKWNLEKISSDIWEKAKDLLENDFVYDDFSFNVAKPEAIKSGVQTNALFAGLLHISICLYSKYDFVVFYTEDDGSGSGKFDDGSEKFGKKAYDNMQNTMLLYVQRAQRFFDKLSENGKEFGVDFLILRFSENFSDKDKEGGYLTDRETAERLRKQLIRVTSLTPMLLRTNNLISQYVVQFPQKQMGEAIVKIGEKRFYDRNKKTKDENEKYRWFWESDGYHAMSNYYYVGAIFDFYTYHDYYEKRYSSNLDKLKEDLSNDIKYEKSVQKYYQKIANEKEEFKAQLEEECNKKLKDKDDLMKAALDEAEKSKSDKKSSEKLISGIEELVENAIDKPEFLKKIIKGFRKQLAEEVFERYSKDTKEDKEDLEKLKKPVEPEDDSFFSLLQALAADIILQSAIKQKTNLKREVDDLGDFSGFKPAKVALIGGKQLIKGNKGNKGKGLINKLFAETFAHVELDKVQETEQEKEK